MLHLALLQWLHERDAGGQEHAQQGGRHGQAAQRVTQDLYLVSIYSCRNIFISSRKIINIPKVHKSTHFT